MTEKGRRDRNSTVEEKKGGAAARALKIMKKAIAIIAVYIAAASALALVFGTSWAVFALPAALAVLHLVTDFDAPQWAAMALQTIAVLAGARRRR